MHAALRSACIRPRRASALRITPPLPSQWGDVRAQIAGLAILNVFALFVTGVLETVLRDRLKARQSQGYLRFYHSVRPLAAVPFRAFAAGVGALLLVACWQHEFPEGLSALLLLQLIMVVEVGLTAGALIRLGQHVREHNAAAAPPDAVDELSPSLFAPDAPLSEATLQERWERQAELNRFLAERVRHLSRQLVQQQLRSSRASGGGGAGGVVGALLGRPSSSSAAGGGGAGAGGSGSGGAGGASPGSLEQSRADLEHRIQAKEQELRSLAAERSRLAGQVQQQTQLLSEKEAQLANAQSLQDAQWQENARLRAMLDEWSARSLKLERRILSLEATQEGGGGAAAAAATEAALGGLVPGGGAGGSASSS